MTNPWLKKNPFLSMWLSGANRVGGSVRGRATAAAQRQTTAAMSTAAREVLDFWTGGLAPRPAAKKRARKRK